MTPKALFHYYAQNITELIEFEGVVFRAYADPSLKYFSRLPRNEQNEVIANLRLYSEICTRVFEKGGSLCDNRLMTMTALEMQGLSVKPEDFALIEPEHYVEMYSLHHVQFFRSFNILEYSSYTFEDLCCRKWYDLYEREAGVHEKMVEKVTQFFAQKEPVRMAPGLGINRIVEKATLERLLCLAEMLWLVPIWKNGIFAGAMTIIKNHNPGIKKV